MRNLAKSLLLAESIAVLVLVIAGCNRTVTYSIPSNMGSTYSVSLSEQDVTVYKDEDQIARLDTSLRLTRVVFYQDELYLVEEGIVMTAFYTLTGEEVARTTGSILIAEADTILFYRQAFDYDDQENAYSYLSIEKIDFSAEIDSLSKFDVVEVKGKRYICGKKLDESISMYNLRLEPVELKAEIHCQFEENENAI